MHIIKIGLKKSAEAQAPHWSHNYGIAVAVIAFGLLRTVVTAWYAGVDASSANA